MVRNMGQDNIKSRTAVKQQHQLEMPDLSWNEPANNWKTSVEFNDMCDHLIDKILCDLQLEDLAIISDTSTRLRAIASSVFLRKHARRLISMDVFHYLRSISDDMRNGLRQGISPYCKDVEMVRISDAKIWFKLLRNFGGFIKHVRIQDCHYMKDTRIPHAMQNLTKYISDFCDDSLETLYEEGCKFPSLNKPLRKLQEYYCNCERFGTSEVIEFMPNLRSVLLEGVPRAMAKVYANLERVRLQVEDDELQRFITFLQLNRQIKYLHLSVGHSIKRENNHLIYSTIADNLTELKTLKLFVFHQPEVIRRYRFNTVESFATDDVNRRIIFDFDVLKEVTLRGYEEKSSYCMDLARRNKKLKKLKIYDPDDTFLKADFIQNLLRELPELEQIIVYGEYDYSELRSVLSKKWEQFEKVKNERGCQRFRKIESVRQHR